MVTVKQFIIRFLKFIPISLAYLSWDNIKPSCKPLSNISALSMH